MALLASSIDLTTVAAVKDYAEVASNAKNDLIQFVITAFSQYALIHTGRDTLNSVQQYSELRNGTGSERMFLRNSPILSVISLIIGPVTFQASSGFGSAGYFIEQSKRSIALRSGSMGMYVSALFPGMGDPFFPKGIGNVQVVYTAGYTPISAINEIHTIALQTISLDEAPWASDIGVLFYPSLVPLVKVLSAPATGQYAVSGGLYVFAAADNTKQVAVSYTYNSPPFDLAFAATQAAAVNFKRTQWIDQASKSLSAGGATGTTRYRDWKLPPEVQQVLSNYKRMAMG